MKYLVMDRWNVLVTILDDMARAKRAARSVGGYVVIRSTKKA